jgi:hypothetical protein
MPKEEKSPFTKEKKKPRSLVIVNAERSISPIEWDDQHKVSLGLLYANEGGVGRIGSVESIG